jgi:hypothetical protein
LIASRPRFQVCRGGRDQSRPYKQGNYLTRHNRLQCAEVDAINRVPTFGSLIHLFMFIIAPLRNG